MRKTGSVIGCLGMTEDPTSPQGQEPLIVASEKNLCAFWTDFGSVLSAHISAESCDIRFESDSGNTQSLLVRAGPVAPIPDNMTLFEEMWGLACDMSLMTPDQIVKDCTFIRARTKQARGVWGRIVAGDAFGRDEMRLPEFPDKPRYLALCGGQPVAASALVLRYGVAGVHCVRTLPRFRGRGFARSLILASSIDAKRRGFHTAVVLSSVPTTAMYQRFGFRRLSLYRVYTTM